MGKSLSKIVRGFTFIWKKEMEELTRPLIFKQEERLNNNAMCNHCAAQADGAEMDSDLGSGPSHPQRSHLRHCHQQQQHQQHHQEVNRVNCCIKYLMFVFNFAFAVMGCLVLGVGVWGLIDKESLVLDTVNHLSTDPMLVFVSLGLVVSVMSFSGCAGALRENECLLKFFTVGIIVFVTAEVAGGIAVYALRDRIGQYLENGMILAVKRYQDDPDLRFIMNEIQEGLKCCGVESYHDWELNMYFNCSSPGVHACGAPASCCINPQENGTVRNSQCGFGTLHMEEVVAQNYIYLRGCMSRLTSWLNSNMGSIGAIGVILMVTQVVGLIFATKVLSDIELIKAHW